MLVKLKVPPGAKAGDVVEFTINRPFAKVTRRRRRRRRQRRKTQGGCQAAAAKRKTMTAQGGYEDEEEEEEEEEEDEDTFKAHVVIPKKAKPGRTFKARVPKPSLHRGGYGDDDDDDDDDDGDGNGSDPERGMNSGYGNGTGGLRQQWSMPMTTTTMNGGVRAADSAVLVESDAHLSSLAQCLTAVEQPLRLSAQQLLTLGVGGAAAAASDGRGEGLWFNHNHHTNSQGHNSTSSSTTNTTRQPRKKTVLGASSDSNVGVLIFVATDDDSASRLVEGLRLCAKFYQHHMSKRSRVRCCRGRGEQQQEKDGGGGGTGGLPLEEGRE
jgi:hypothetical protein